MFVRPKTLEITNVGFNQYTIKLEPLECGFGHTFGVVFRRIFLSLLSGYAITHVRILKVLNEFVGCRGIKEDTVDVLNNLKKVKFLLVGCSELTLSITKIGITRVVAGDFCVSSNIIILNSEQLIATITDSITVTFDIKVNKGYGYCFRNSEKTYCEESGWISLNSSYSPIISSFFKVESFFLEGYFVDKLIMFITTNGTIDPRKCVYEAGYLLFKQLPFFSNIFNDINTEFFSIRAVENEEINITPVVMMKRIDELELSVRSLNCLKLAKIFFLKDLIKKSENDLLGIVNFGKKSLLEVKDALSVFGLKLSTCVDNFEGYGSFNDET